MALVRKKNTVTILKYESGMPRAVIPYFDSTLPNGHMIVWDEHGKKILEGRFDKGNRYGPWCEYYSNGNKKSCGWYCDSRPGYYGGFHDDDLDGHGEWKFWLDETDETHTLVGKYNDGSPIGDWIHCENGESNTISASVASTLIDRSEYYRVLASMRIT